MSVGHYCSFYPFFLMEMSAGHRGFVYGILVVKTHGSVNGSMFNLQDLAGCNACLSHLCDICVCSKYWHVYKYTKYIYICTCTKTYIQTLLCGRREWDNIPKHSWFLSDQNLRCETPPVKHGKNMATVTGGASQRKNP